MGFEDKVNLFVSVEELNSTEVKEFMQRNKIPINLDIDEGIVSIYLNGADITISFILELEDVLNSRITLCSRYIGSSKIIESIGLN